MPDDWRRLKTRQPPAPHVTSPTTSPPESAPANLLRREVLPFALSLVALVGGTLVVDAALHQFDVVWVGRYLGIPGVLLILGSFGYSLRKRKIIQHGSPVQWLRRHERLAWAGSLLVLVHAGVHFNAWLPWLATAAMLVNVASGLTGKFLLERARKRLGATRKRLTEQGFSAEEQEALLHRDALTFDIVKRWRVVHFPIALAFGLLALTHLVAIALFWGWR